MKFWMIVVISLFLLNCGKDQSDAKLMDEFDEIAKNAEAELKLIPPVIAGPCTEWKGICKGDTVFHFYMTSDTLTCVVTKIIVRPGSIGDLIGARRLDGGHVVADEAYFYKELKERKPLNEHYPKSTGGYKRDYTSLYVGSSTHDGLL